MRAGSHRESAAGPPTGRLRAVLLPELQRFAEGERRAALRAARRCTAFDAVELLGMAAALVAVTALMRWVLPGAAASGRPLSVAVELAFALPLLALAIAPLVRRRLRRGLREQLQHRGVR